MPPTIKDIENAFQPAREVADADRFAGRHQAVQDAYFGLIAEGANLAVIGNRGIGKTSLSRQISNIASGDVDLLERLKISVDGPLDFLSVYFACGDNVRTIDDLLSKLLTTRSCLGDWIYDIAQARKEIESYAPEISAKLFGAGVQLGGEKTTELESSPAIERHDLGTVFTNVCDAIVSSGVARDGLLIVIDEFDQIDDPSGAAGLMKAMATNVPGLKFCIVGVANDITNLLREHKSSDRLFAGAIISLPSMSDSELVEIVRIAESTIDDFIKFDDEADRRLVELAQGHPYMVHLVGKYALRRVYQAGGKQVTGTEINDTLRSIASSGADPVLEGRYRKAVGSSPQREIVLRSMATVMSGDGESWTTDAYKIALDAGVDNASQYVGQLVTDEYGAEIEKARERYYRFRDSLFAAYVLARPRRFS